MDDHPLAVRVRRLAHRTDRRAPGDGEPGSREYAAHTRYRVEQLERQQGESGADLRRLLWVVLAAVIAGVLKGLGVV